MERWWSRRACHSGHVDWIAKLGAPALSGARASTGNGPGKFSLRHACPGAGQSARASSACAGGIDPIAARRARRSALSAEQQAQRTFSEVAAQYIAQHEKSWKSAKHQAQWASTLRRYAEPVIGKLLVRDIRTAHVIGVLEPIWTTKTETATRVRSRIELVLDYAAARGYREGLNPARWSSRS